MAVKYGATTEHVFNTFLPETFTRHTFWTFGSLMVVGLVLLRAVGHFVDVNHRAVSPCTAARGNQKRRAGLID